MGQNNLATNISALHRTKMQSGKCQKKITTAHWFFLYHIARRDAGSNIRSKKPMRGWYFQ
jgi:hypothetical protein